MEALVYYNPSIQADYVPPYIVLVLFSKHCTVSEEAILRWLEWMQYLLLNLCWIKCVWAAGQNYLLFKLQFLLGGNKNVSICWTFDITLWVADMDTMTK